MMTKILSKIEYDNINKVQPSVLGDYEKYLNQMEWHRLVKKLTASIKRRKTDTPHYKKIMNEFISLCERNNLPKKISQYK